MLRRRLDRLPRERVVGIDAAVARTPGARLLGLALLDRAAVDVALWIPRCRSVHTFGMRFDLDLRFLDADGRELSRREAVPPSRFAGDRRASSVLELPAE